MGLGTGLFPGALWAEAQEAGELTDDVIRAAQELAGLDFTESERAMMLEGLRNRREGYARLREVETPADLPPAFVYDPELILSSRGIPADRTRAGDVAVDSGGDVGSGGAPLPRPASDADLAFLGIDALGRLLRSGEVTSVELTEIYLERLGRHGPRLECVITVTEERAFRQAEAADEELSRGADRGPLHGIPWGVKDLFAVEGYPTTWGAAPFQEQVFDETATAVRRLDEAGAVLVAKLTLGALAMGDVWFGGQTRNPWDPEQGSSGSSAGSSAAVAAGLVPFALGTETLGSIVSPARRCGVTGLRPTFGRVSRAGAMPLSWTMDKVGPLARSAGDCGRVLAAIHGRDPLDPSSRSFPFPWAPTSESEGSAGEESPVDNGSHGGLRIGFDRIAFDASDVSPEDRGTLDVFRRLGVEPLPVELPRFLPADEMTLLLEVEAGAAFDALTRSGGVDELVRQDSEAWPTLFRVARLIPGVEYVQANRLRARLLVELEEVLAPFDAVVTPSFAQGVLPMTNLTGHPAIQLPNGFRSGRPVGVSFVGPLWGEAGLLRVASAYQSATDHHRRRPPAFG